MTPNTLKYKWIKLENSLNVYFFFYFFFTFFFTCPSEKLRHFFFQKICCSPQNHLHVTPLKLTDGLAPAAGCITFAFRIHRLVTTDALTAASFYTTSPIAVLWEHGMMGGGGSMSCNRLCYRKENGSEMTL